MLDVIIALVPASIASVVFFGWRALMLIGVCIASCVLCEYISRKVMKRDTTIGDLSAVVTGLLLALNLPPSLNPLIAIFGSIVAPSMIKLFRIKDPMVAGVSIGTCAHGGGASKAVQLGETQGAMSSLAIGVAGICTVVISLFL